MILGAFELLRIPPVRLHEARYQSDRSQVTFGGT